MNKRVSYEWGKDSVLSTLGIGFIIQPYREHLLYSWTSMDALDIETIVSLKIKNFS